MRIEESDILHTQGYQCDRHASQYVSIFQSHPRAGERDGLTSEEAKKRMEEYGPNEIPVT